MEAARTILWFLFLTAAIFSGLFVGFSIRDIVDNRKERALHRKNLALMKKEDQRRANERKDKVKERRRMERMLEKETGISSTAVTEKQSGVVVEDTFSDERQSTPDSSSSSSVDKECQKEKKSLKERSVLAAERFKKILPFKKAACQDEGDQDENKDSDENDKNKQKDRILCSSMKRFAEKTKELLLRISPKKTRTSVSLDERLDEHSSFVKFVCEEEGINSQEEIEKNRKTQDHKYHIE